MKNLAAVILVFSISIFLGCGGGGSSSTNTISSGEQVNKVADANALIEVNATNNAVDINESDTIEDNENSLSIKKTYDENDIGKPLFIDGEFRGIVSNLEKVDDNTSHYTMKDADSIDEAYKSITLDFSSGDNLKYSLRALSKKHLRGKYDYLNPNNPIKTHFYSTKSKLRNGNTQEDLILRVDIPKNYIFPAGDHLVKNPLRGTDSYVSCTFDLEACTIAANNQIENTIAIGTSSTIEPSFTISTEDSYIEYKIGAIIHFSYTNVEYLNNQPALAFNYIIDASMDLNLKFEAKGEASKKIVKEYEITDGFALEIFHPGSAVAKTSVFFQPKIEFGASAKIEGTVTATSKVKRKLQIKVDYKGNSPAETCNPSIVGSCEEISILNKYINYENEAYDITESELTADIEAEASAWASPNISVSPQIKLLRVTTPIYLGEIDGGATVVGSINGKIGASYIIDNSKGEYDSYAEVGVNVQYYFFVNGEFFVKVGDREFLKTEPAEWYRSKAKKVFDWHMQVLHEPSIEVTQKDAQTDELIFKTDIGDENISKKVLFYYTTDGSDPVYDDTKRVKSSLWDGKPISVSETTTYKVLAVLKNRDISDSVWAFGESISAIAEKEVDMNITISLPTAIPNDGTVFTKESMLSVTLTHELDYQIFYTTDGSDPTSSSTLYEAPIIVTQTMTLKAIAIQGLRSSKVAIFNYYLNGDKTCQGGIITYKPSWCYDPSTTGCWRKACNIPIACNEGDGDRNTTLWWEKYEPHSQTGELLLDHVVLSKLVQQPNGKLALCAQRIENWNESGTLGYTTNYDITQNYSGCWYSDEKLCPHVCPDVSTNCEATYESYSSSESSSSSSLASSSSSELSSSSEASSSQQMSSSSSSEPIENPNGYTGIQIWVLSPEALGISTYGEIYVQYVKTDYDNLVRLEDKDIAAECSYSVTSGTDVIDVNVVDGRVEVIGKKSGTATIEIIIPTQYTQDADYVNDTVEVTVTL